MVTEQGMLTMASQSILDGNSSMGCGQWVSGADLASQAAASAARRDPSNAIVQSAAAQAAAASSQAANTVCNRADGAVAAYASSALAAATLAVSLARADLLQQKA